MLAVQVHIAHGRDVGEACVTGSWSPREISLLFKWLAGAYPSAGCIIMCGRQPTRVATSCRIYKRMWPVCAKFTASCTRIAELRLQLCNFL